LPALAKRIVNYLQPGQQVNKPRDGFYHPGWRVDLLLPLNAKVQVKIDEMAKGGDSVATW
jgi:phosphatidylserine decarboxylase